MASVAKIIEEIGSLFGDTSVPQETTKANLQEIIDECESRIASLEDV